MASSGKKKTTMAKLNRENRKHEKRAEKNARKEARKSGLVPAPAAAEDETAEDAWQLTRGLDNDDLA
jgi:hypothetical protein